MSTLYLDFLDRKYATHEEWEKAIDAWKREPVICAHCLHPIDFDIDAGLWRHKESVAWCDRQRRFKPIQPVAQKKV